MELVQQCAVLRASSFQRTIACIQSANKFYSLTSNRPQKLTDGRMPLLAAFCPWGFFLMKLYESKAHSPTQPWWRSWNLTLLLLNTCVQRTECRRLARCRHRSQLGEGAPPADTPGLWRSHWDLLPLWAQPQERLAPVLQKPEEQKQEKKEVSLKLSLGNWGTWMWFLPYSTASNRSP